MKMAMLSLILTFGFGTLQANELCQQAVDRELSRLALGSFDKPAVGTEKIRSNLVDFISGRTAGQVTFFMANKSDFPGGYRYVELFQFGPEDKNIKSFPTMFNSEAIQQLYLNYQYPKGGPSEYLIRIRAGDKHDLTFFGTILLLINSDCKVVKAEIRSSTNVYGGSVNADFCKNRQKGDLTELGTLCDRYF